MNGDIRERVNSYLIGSVTGVLVIVVIHDSLDVDSLVAEVIRGNDIFVGVLKNLGTNRNSNVANTAGKRHSSLVAACLVGSGIDIGNNEILH